MKKTNNKNNSTGILLPLAGVLFVVMLIFFTMLITIDNSEKNQNTNTSASATMNTFDSCVSLHENLLENGSYNNYRGDIVFFDASAPTSAQKSESSGAVDFSQTNIQVAGVDEADIVKSDGKNIYTISNNTVNISRAYPVENVELLSTIKYNSPDTPTEMFLDENNLMVFGTFSSRYEEKELENERDYYYPQNNKTFTFVEIYSLKDPENPELKRRLEIEGNYSTSRKIGEDVYFVTNSYPNYYALEEKTDNILPSDIVPVYRDVEERISGNYSDYNEISRCQDVSYIDPIESSQYVTVAGISISDYEKPIDSKVILGGGENIYASQTGLYLAKTSYNYNGTETNEDMIIPDNNEETVVYKFILKEGEISYQGESTVPGTVLNQFSMDEHKKYFRIATTIGHVSRSGSDSTNNIYILNDDLQLVGSVEDIAPGEKIYSARFMGDKGYLVTFKKVDPFFTFDLSDPKNPKIIGKLKIPGYSDYLHPYDENHIIGIGKDTVEAESEDGSSAGFAWYQGMKMAIFDVTDFANPKELHKIVIGDRGTSSPVLSNHKALLFSKDKNLLALPITLAEISDEVKDAPTTPDSTSGDFVFQGTYVYDISIEDGFVLKGEITHVEDQDSFKKSGYYYSGGDDNILRNLYIEDNLYSVSNNKIKINSLESLDSLGEIKLK